MTTFYRVTVEAFFTTAAELDVVPKLTFKADDASLPMALKAMADAPESLMEGIANNLDFPGTETMRPMTREEMDEYLAEED